MNIEDRIAEMDAADLAAVLTVGLKRLGDLGAPAAGALLGKIMDSGGYEGFVVSGLQYVSNVEGVLDGRLDAL